MDWEKIFASDETNKGLIPKYTTAHTTQYQTNKHNKQPNQKLGRKPK